MNIRKIISEELKRVFSENYPMGAENHPDAPWNQVDKTKEGEKAKEIVYDLTWTDNSEYAFFRDSSGNAYVLYIDSIERSELEPYADREEIYLGRDEDGFPDVEYGEWEITGEVLENYVNDSLGGLKIGRGLDDFYTADYDLVMIDDDLRNYLFEIADYIKDENKRKSFIDALGGTSN